MRAAPEIRRLIETVETGRFDHVLRRLEGEHLGIHIPTHALDGVVVPMPAGYGQTEANLHIAISNESVKDGVRVGWYGGGPTASCWRSSHACCEGHPVRPPNSSAHTPSGHVLLTNAAELHPAAIATRVETMRADGSLPLDELAFEGVGVFMLHGHGCVAPFTTLPNGVMSVIENGRTYFRRRSEVLGAGGFVPTTWRFEEGERQPVGGFA